MSGFLNNCATGMAVATSHNLRQQSGVRQCSVLKGGTDGSASGIINEVIAD